MKTTTANTFFVSTDELIKNFIASSMDMLNSNIEMYLSPKDFSLDLESFSVQLNNLLKNDNTFKEFQTLFREGYSMMLLNPADLDTLELLDKNNEDYQLLINDSNDRCIGVLQKDDISW